VTSEGFSIKTTELPAFVRKLIRPYFRRREVRVVVSSRATLKRAVFEYKQPWGGIFDLASGSGKVAASIAGNGYGLDHKGYNAVSGEEFDIPENTIVVTGASDLSATVYVRPENLPRLLGN
jgi:hypothetical protein